MSSFNFVPLPEDIHTFATTYSLGDNNLYKRPITLEIREQIKGPDLWCIKMSGDWCLTKDLQWEWEPMPSSRSDEFIRRTRFASRCEALIALKTALLKPSPDKLYIG